MASAREPSCPQRVLNRFRSTVVSRAIPEKFP
jgi:hypothetical protein